MSISFYEILQSQNTGFDIDESPYVQFKKSTSEFIQSIEYVSRGQYSNFYPLYFSLDSEYRDRFNQVSIFLIEEILCGELDNA